MKRVIKQTGTIEYINMETINVMSVRSDNTVRITLTNPNLCHIFINPGTPEHRTLVNYFNLPLPDDDKSDTPPPYMSENCTKDTQE